MTGAGALPRVATAGLVVLLAVTAAACTRAAGPGAAGGAEGTSRAPVRLAAVGDSITQADGDVASRRPGSTSWVTTAATDGVVLAGGWARGGATTIDMAAAVEPVDADVLVVMAGTNDATLGLPFERSADALRRVVATVAVPVVVVSAVPPRDDDPALAAEYNHELRRLAADEGWTYADPMGDVRRGDRWVRGTAVDDVHPNAEGARRIGAALREEVLAAARAAEDG